VFRTRADIQSGDAHRTAQWTATATPVRLRLQRHENAYIAAGLAIYQACGILDSQRGGTQVEPAAVDVAAGRSGPINIQEKGLNIGFRHRDASGEGRR
jgi:hypothetical protein